MSAEISGNKMIISLEIALEDRKYMEDLKKYVDEFERLDRVESKLMNEDESLEQALKDAVDEAIDEAGETGSIMDIPAGGTDSKGKPLYKTAQRGLSQGLEGIQDPKGFILTTITHYLPMIAPVLLLPMLVEAVIREITKPGGWFDMRFKRDIPAELNNLFSRMEKQNRRLGITQVIITSTTGFRQMQGANSGNTFAHIRESGYANIGLVDKAAGWRP